MKSARSSLEKKYYDACTKGDIVTIEYMTKKEGKSLKSDYFLAECLRRLCNGADNGADNGANNGANNNSNNHINACKIIIQYRDVSKINSQHDMVVYACKKGKLKFVKYYLNTPFNTHYIKRNPDFLTAYLYYSCKSGCLDLIKFMLQKVGTSCFKSLNWENLEHWDIRVITKCLQNACESGNIESVNLFVKHKKYRDLIHKYMSEACAGGNIEIVKLVIGYGDGDGDGKLASKLTFNPNYMFQAGCGGNIDIIKLLVQTEFKYSEYFDSCMRGACFGDHIEVVKYIIDTINLVDDINMEECMNIVCSCNRLDIVKFMVEKGPTNFNVYARTASMYLNGDSEILKFMVEKGADDFDLYLYHACFYGDLDFVRILVEKGIEKGITNWNNGLLGACKGNNLDLVKLMIKYGATNLNECLHAVKNTNLDIVIDTDTINILLLNGANDFDCLLDSKDFRLHCLWLKFIGIKPDRHNAQWLQLIKDYPPYVLLVGSLLSKNIMCSIRRLPVEIFTLLY